MVDECIYHSIGRLYQEGKGGFEGQGRKDMSMPYYQLSAERGYVNAYVDMYKIYYDDLFATYPDDQDKAVALLLEAEEKGIKDERIYALIVTSLLDKSYTPSPSILGNHASQGTMALYYADMLIQSGSQLGYIVKGDVYYQGVSGVPRDLGKAMEIWEEGHKLGLIDLKTYTDKMAKL